VCTNYLQLESIRTDEWDSKDEHTHTHRDIHTETERNTFKLPVQFSSLMMSK